MTTKPKKRTNEMKAPKLPPEDPALATIDEIDSLIVSLKRQLERARSFRRAVREAYKRRTRQ